MAITYITGFEFEAKGEMAQDTGSSSYITGGRNGFQLVCTMHGASAQVLQNLRLAGGTFTAFARSASVYIKLITAFSSNVTILATLNGTPSLVDRLQLNTDGTLTVTDGTNSATSTLTLTAGDGLWHKVAFDVGWSSGAGRRVYVDDVLWASTAIGTSVAQIQFHSGIWENTTSGSIAFDDLIVDDDTFANSGFPGDYNVTLLPPISDNTLGNWVAGGGAVTSVFDAINNLPPVGVASASSTNASQIKNSVSSANNDGLFNCQTYTAGGIFGAVNAVMPVANHSSSSTTVTAGALYMSSNPAQVAPGHTFDYDNGGAVAGTYPTGWKTQIGPVSVAPAVSLGSSPVVAIRKTTATTRITFADLLGVYVAWSPWFPPSITEPYSPMVPLLVQ